ncbi:MAG: GTPase HflX [Christensenellaceae bacterium]|nr:GTPase HflX [Christensenellaceae bacterium]
MVKGNTEGIRASLLAEIERLGEMEIERDEFAPEGLLRALAACSARINREISLYLTREGDVVDITIGSDRSVPLERMHLRRDLGRLSGLRCLHTHPGGDPTLSPVDLQSLKRLRFDAMAALGVAEDGSPAGLCAAFLGEMSEDGSLAVELTRAYPIQRIPQEEFMRHIEEIDRRISSQASAPEQKAERALLVGLGDSPDSQALMELSRLAETAGAEVVGRFNQNRQKVDTATYIGSGKAEELSLIAQSLDADLMIFDDELSGAQVRNLEELLPCRVVDRTALILDIFARRASSREGRLQVELAQMRYRLPRLTGLGTALSRLGGGIGTRGPGETKLEVDRRRIRRRMTDIERELAELERQRDLRRSRRERHEMPVAALVGYTNAGKSSLLNRLSGADVLAEDKLFATLDPVTRRVRLPGGTRCLLTDTVGFINKLPHDLVRAFHSTLEEAAHADLLLIVRDVSDDHFAMQGEVVEEVLRELGAAETPRLYLLNKADRAPEIQPEREDTLLISATEGQGIEELLQKIEEKLLAASFVEEFFVPYARGEVMAFLRGAGQLQSEEYGENGSLMRVRLSAADRERAKKMLGG